MTAPIESAASTHQPGAWREMKPMLRLAVPIVLAEIGWMSMGIVDTIMVGHISDALPGSGADASGSASALAIGAVSLGQGLYYTVAIFGSGLLLGLDTLVAQAFGRREHDEANLSLLHSIYLALMLSPLLMGIVWLWPPLIRQMGVPVEVLRGMGPFLNALNWSTLPLLLYFALRRYLQAVDVLKPVTFALVSANIVNALFNWIFIFGHWGARAYGVAGSGWSTCVARIYMALVLLLALLYNNRQKHWGLLTTGLKLEWERIRSLLALGLPAASQILFEIGGFTAATALCGKLGAVALAGHQIAINCAAFTFMVPLGIGSAAAVRVGQEIGRNDPRSARRAGWTAMLLGSAFMSCSALTFLLFPRQLARIFSPDPAVVRMGASLLLIAAAFQLFDGLQTVATGALRGAGDTRSPMLANLIAYWAIGLPVGWLLCFKLGWGAPGLWIGLCLGLILIGITLVLVWKHKVLIQPGA
ncbi:MAG TPA: MATE family efflux transporter [Terriglobales bacterium]